MSFDDDWFTGMRNRLGLNPFGTGQCLSTMKNYAVKACSIRLNPFGTGQCLSTFWSFSHLRPFLSLNPFGTGQCLSTYDANPELVRKARLNPFGTGQCLSTYYKNGNLVGDSSQSLWNRAVSFDCSGVLKPCGTRLARATFQLFPRLRELGLDLIKCCTNFNILFTYQAVENRGDFTRVFRFY